MVDKRAEDELRRLGLELMTARSPGRRRVLLVDIERVKDRIREAEQLEAAARREDVRG